MGTASDLVKQMKNLLGLGESPPGSNHNKVTVWYNDEIDHIGDGPWCDMAVTYAAGHSDNLKAIQGGEGVGFAYTVWHVDAFQAAGCWHQGMSGIKPGDVVFYDWDRTGNPDKVDHVGVVEEVDGSEMYVIEGNVDNVCKRVLRDSKYVVGYGRPKFSSKPPPKPVEETVKRVCVLGVKHTTPVPPNSRTSIAFDYEYVDTNHIHPDKDSSGSKLVPSIYPEKTQDFILHGRVTVDGLGAGDRVELEIAGYELDSNDFAYVVDGVSRTGDGKPAFRIEVARPDQLRNTNKYRLDVLNPNDYEIVVTDAQFSVSM